MASKYLRKQTWWLEYWLRGRRIRESTGLPDWDAEGAEIRRKEKELEIARGRALVPVKKRIDEFIQEHKFYLADRIKDPRYKQNVESQILKFSQFVGATYLTDVYEKDVRDFLLQIGRCGYSKYQTPNGVGESTYNKYRLSIHMFFKYAIERGYLKENPVARIKQKKAAKKPPRFLSRAEIWRLLRAARKSKLYAFVVVKLYTGMRLSEVIRLQWPNINFETGSILAEKTKGRKFRVIPMPPQLNKFLSRIRQEKGYVVTKPDGEPYKTDPRAEFKNIVEAANITFEKGDGFHILRHNYASWLRMSGVSLDDIKELLGHEQVTTTQIYAHISAEHLRAAVNKLSFAPQNTHTAKEFVLA